MPPRTPTDSIIPGPGRHLRWIPWLLVVAAEFMLFMGTAARHHAAVYPRWNDQIQPLTEAYTTYEQRRKEGFWAGVNHALTMPAAQGNQHALWALLAFEAGGGASRRAALAVNMLLFVLWQLILVVAVTRSGSRPLPWLAAGLLLALHWPWSGIQGAATDFRLDQATMCLMGISLAAALQTDGFRNRHWTLTFGFAVGLTIITRFLAATYFTVIFGACLAWLLWARDRGPRVRNLLLAGVAAAAVVLPIFWIHRRDIYDHYWIGHYHNPDGLLWSSGLSFTRAFFHVWKQLLVWQVGVVFWATVAAVAGLLGVGWLITRRARGTPAPAADEAWSRQAAILGTIFLMAPVLVLSVQNNDKMVVVVLGAAVPGLVVLVLAAVAWLSARGPGPRLAWAAAGLALVGGGAHFVQRQITRPYSDDFLAGARQVEAVANRIFRTVQTSGLERPRIAVDHVTDCFDGTILSVITYERHQVWIPFVMQLPTGISRTTEEVLMAHLAESDFVFVTEAGRAGDWPYEQQMGELRPKILAWCEANLRAVERFELFGRRLALYQRRDIGVPPVFDSPMWLRASLAGDFAHPVKITRGQARYRAAGLPPGLGIDAASGVIRGRPTRAGNYRAEIIATNAAGASTHGIEFLVEEAAFVVRARAPDSIRAGEPVVVEFEAFDAQGNMDFIDLTDMTTARNLGRASAGKDRRDWQGHHRLELTEPGLHVINLRFVRLHPDRKGEYDFMDRQVEINVLPPAAARR